MLKTYHSRDNNTVGVGMCKAHGDTMNPSSQMYQTGLMLQYMILMLVTVSPSSNILTEWALLK